MQNPDPPIHAQKKEEQIDTDSCLCVRNETPSVNRGYPRYRDKRMQETLCSSSQLLKKKKIIITDDLDQVRFDRRVKAICVILACYSATVRQQERTILHAHAFHQSEQKRLSPGQSEQLKLTLDQSEQEKPSFFRDAMKPDNGTGFFRTTGQV